MEINEPLSTNEDTNENASPQAFVRDAESAPLEGWESNPGMYWRTHVSANRTPSAEMTAGVCTLHAGANLGQLHWHAQPEVYHFTSGTGVVHVDDDSFDVTVGSTVFVPGGAWHTIVNTGSENLELFYCFATDSFTDVKYHYFDGSTWEATLRSTTQVDE